jgi:two-component system, OmpR family, sensor histidine kinase MtrB
VTWTFAVGGFIFSGLLAAMTFVISQHFLLSQRQTNATHSAYVNARLVRDGLEAIHPNLSEVLASPRGSTTSASLIERHGSWYSSSVGVDEAGLPPGLRKLVASGKPGRQRFSGTSGVELAVGVPLPAVGAEYFELFDLSELNRTLTTLLAVLVVVAVATAAPGAIVGTWASRRVLRPVTEVAWAAATITRGKLDTRLPPNPDPDLNELGASFNAMVTSMTERIERDFRFASNVSHELRSPLTTLAASAEMLQRHRTELDGRACQALDLLTGDLGRFRRLVTDLLDISLADAGMTREVTERVTVGELVVQAMDANGYGEVPIEIDALATAAVIQVDKRRVERAVVNLLDNARDHAAGATRVTVTMVDERVRILVDDDGAGVPEEDRQTIFERFARGHAPLRQTSNSGVGLGLAIVEEHTRRYGGHCWVDTAPSGGGRFIIELPTKGRR